MINLFFVGLIVSSNLTVPLANTNLVNNEAKEKGLINVSENIDNTKQYESEPKKNIANAVNNGVQNENFQIVEKKVKKSVVLRSTAYNSIPNQTDSTPFITATGSRTRVGVVALSRDMLKVFPYGTKIRIEDLSGKHPYVNNRVFVVEDTMHPRKRNQIDVWMPTRKQALHWGVRQVRITAVD